MIYSQKGTLYFQIFRQRIPTQSDLDTIINTHKAQSSEISSHYQFISQNKIEMDGRPAVEYVYREFRGEPYEQIREIWMEHNGWAYTLACTNPADSTPGVGYSCRRDVFSPRGRVPVQVGPGKFWMRVYRTDIAPFYLNGIIVWFYP